MIRLSTAKILVSFLCAVFIICASLILPSDNNTAHDQDFSVSKVLALLGDETERHVPRGKDFSVSASRGETLIKEGIATKPGGGKTKIQSKHFVCTSCHNLEREDPDLSVSDPQARLDYTAEKGLPFLQGTSLYGVVNRETFYNDDYYKKYGDLMIPARNDLREAIQLCAVECAQGRKLVSWELESVLAYLWSIDLKLSDLNLTEEEIESVYSALDKNENNPEVVELIKSKYLQGSPATFGSAYDSMVKKDDLVGNPDNGKKIYENSCLYCHEDRKYSFFQLDDERLTFKHLSKKASGYGSHSIYQVTRYGIQSFSGKNSYMPQYPYEKMSEQQLADLRSYIDLRAQ